MTLSPILAQTFAIETVRALRALVVPEAREVGDVRRNAAAYLARKAADRRSSFESNLRPVIDATRLTELPYLASLGFLLSAELLREVPQNQLHLALGSVVRRAAYTAERTGYADDAMCACGLFLLARWLKDDRISQLLRERLEEAPASDAAVSALLAVSMATAVRSNAAIDIRSPEQVAAALLLHRVDESLCRKSFPGCPSDLEGHLLGLVAAGTCAMAADFGAMLVLAALEVSLALPDDEFPAEDGRCDAGIVVALKEEFRILFERFESRHAHVEDGGRSYYVFDVPTLVGRRPYRCVATLVGEMGTNRTGIIVEKMLARWDPSVVAIVGIAGGVHSDVRVGDVIVASEVDNYLEGAKAADGGEGFAFQRSSDSFKMPHALLDRIRNFEFANRASFLQWQASCVARRRALGAEADVLLQNGMIREQAVQKEGHIASGPLVVTSKEFVAWIRAGDRACLGVEMEAGGLMISAHMNSARRDALVIRGVSDFSDERKARLDAIGSGLLRRYAMENASDFLWALMESGVLPRGPEPSPSAGRPTPETVEQALLRVLSENADATGEVTATWAEIQRWLGDIEADVHLAAIHLNEAGHFRSATFEGGRDGVCNVVLKRDPTLRT
jgi:nucleoside phosphorylase